MSPKSNKNSEEFFTLFIDTLTGKKFEIIVSPQDTIKIIKNKIQLSEGIPSSHQNLIFNLQELQDSNSLQDYSISDGCALKLVLALRGGPVSTLRRISPMDDALWKKLFDYHRENLLEKMIPGCSVALLVYEEGDDKMNMLKILQKLDTSYSPLQNSLSGSSLSNLLDNDDDDEEEEETDDGMQLYEENSITMKKVNDIKIKLKNLAIQRGHNYKLHPCREIELDNSGYSYNMTGKEEEQPMSILIASNKEKVLKNLPPIETNKVKDLSDYDLSDCSTNIHSIKFSKKPILPFISSTESELLHTGSAVEPRTSPYEHKICDILSTADRNMPLRSTFNKSTPNNRVVPLTNYNSNINLDNDCHNRNKKKMIQPLSKQFKLKSLERFSMNQSGEIISSRSGNSEISSDSKNKSEDAGSQVNKNKISVIYDKSLKRIEEDETVIKEGLSKKNSYYVHKFNSKTDDIIYPLNYSRTNCKELEKPTISLVSETISDKYAINKFHKLNKVTSRTCPEFLSPDDESSRNYYSLVNIKKKNKRRCMECKRKLNLTNAYSCRCNLVFCAIHRYSETHDCDYDYKTEGRKILEKNNPLLTASKLPKI